jgi:hypothetical protein
MTYNVSLVKLGTFTIDEGAVAQRVKALMDAVIESDRGLQRRFAERSAVTWMTSCPDRLNGWELLIYFVPGFIDSVVQGLNADMRPGPGGLTTWRSRTEGRARTEETGSEVYANTGGGDARLLGNLAFHEALHNKGHYSDEQLHRYGGLAGESVAASTDMTAAVRQLMAGILGRDRLQWLGGCRYFNDPIH